MKNTIEKLTEELTPLASLIGNDNLQDVQKRIGDLIVERVGKDLSDYDYYMFYPPDYQDTIDDAFNSIKKKMTKMYSDVMLEVAEKAVEKFKSDAINFVNNMSKPSA